MTCKIYIPVSFDKFLRYDIHKMMYKKEVMMITMLKKYGAIISLASSLILLVLLWLCVAMDSADVRIATTIYMIFYLLFGRWLKKQRVAEENSDNSTK